MTSTIDQSTVDVRRRDTKAAIGALRRAMDADIGVQPRSSWLLPLVAAALGVTAGLKTRRAFKTRRAAKRIGAD